jgi:hypothetical protein
MQRAGPYCGENPGPGKDVYGELEPRPGIRERPRTGPVADALTTKPADLTMVAKKNNGVFPFGRIYDIIDGRHELKSHGARDMSIWGFRYSPAPIPGVNPVAPYFVDPLYDREGVIRARILAVIDYLYRIQ